MKIAVLSGKGGTGKTLVSANLAAVMGEASYLDCDVEEPNGHFFFKPQWESTLPVTVKIPVVDQEKCTGCRTCVNFCKFNALAFIGNRVKVFEDVCHACGGCMLFCPQKAIFEKDKEIGKVMIGDSEGVHVVSGILNTGEASGVPVIKTVLNSASVSHGDTVIDCPPGSACVVMESIKEADYCILVAEPTLFGVHNLKMVYELVQLFNKPTGVILNKCFEGDNPAEAFCNDQGLYILDRIPFDETIGSANSNGRIIARESPHYKKFFESLFIKTTGRYRYETTTRP